MMKRLAVLCTALLLLATAVLPISAFDFSFDWLKPEQWTETFTTVTYEAAIELLSSANANLYLARHASTFLRPEQLRELVSSTRETLLGMDARPSDEQLHALGQAELVGDDSLDVWGHLYAVGDYEVYELLIMDRLADGVEPRYGVTLAQGKFDNYELFSGDNKYAAKIAEQFGLVTYNGPAAKQKPAALAGVTESIGKYDPKADTGTTKSYRVFCDALTSVHLLYVRPSVGGDWRQTLTTTAVYVAETHDWLISSVQAKGEQSFADRLTPDGFDDRLTRAVAAYEAGAPVVDLLESFTATVTLDGEEVELYTLDFAVPDTREWGMIVILGSLSIVVAAGLVVAFLFGRSRRTE